MSVSVVRCVGGALLNATRWSDVGTGQFSILNVCAKSTFALFGAQHPLTALVMRGATL